MRGLRRLLRALTSELPLVCLLYFRETRKKAAASSADDLLGNLAYLGNWVLNSIVLTQGFRINMPCWTHDACVLTCKLDSFCSYPILKRVLHYLRSTPVHRDGDIQHVTFAKQPKALG